MASWQLLLMGLIVPAKSPEAAPAVCVGALSARAVGWSGFCSEQTPRARGHQLMNDTDHCDGRNNREYPHSDDDPTLADHSEGDRR